MIGRCPSFGELAEYWTADVAGEEAARLEEHVFACAACARLLAEAERLREGVGRLARTGGVRAFVTDDLLNRLARDGVRVRTYAVDPGGSVLCAVWADDEVVVARLRADFTGVAAVDAEMRFDSGERWDGVSDVPVPEGARELLLALPADLVRGAPRSPMRLTLQPSAGSPDRGVLAEYVFDHQGAHERPVR
jgi:hypothetical protein